MAKFLTKSGLEIVTTDKDKIECYRAKGLKEVKIEPQPIQEDVKPVDDYVVAKKTPVKKKKVTKKGG